MDEIEAMDTSEIPSLQLKIYETIPIPELPVNISLPLFMFIFVAYMYSCILISLSGTTKRKLIW